MVRVGYCKETAHRSDYKEETPITAVLSVPTKKDQNHLGFWWGSGTASHTAGKQRLPRPENCPNAINSYGLLSIH